MIKEFLFYFFSGVAALVMAGIVLWFFNEAPLVSFTVSLCVAAGLMWVELRSG